MPGMVANRASGRPNCRTNGPHVAAGALRWFCGEGLNGLNFAIMGFRGCVSRQIKIVHQNSHTRACLQ